MGITDDTVTIATASIHGTTPTDTGDTEQSIVGVTLISLTAVLSIFCNLLNFIILPKIPEINDASRVLYMSLSMVDFFTGILLLPMSVASAKGEWPFGRALCKTLGYLLTCTTGLSSSIVFYLNGDRFIAVTKPLRYASLINRSRVITVTVSQAIGTLITLFFLLYFAGDRFNIIIFREFGVCMVDFSEPHFAPVTIFSFAISMWMYALLILIFYAVMLRIVRRHSRTIATQAVVAFKNASTARAESNTRTSEQYQNDVERAEKQARNARQRGLVKSVLLAVSISGAFYVAWLPFTICEVISAVRGRQVPADIVTVASRLTLCNGWMNTIIYLLLKESYRKAVVDYIRKLRHSPIVDVQ